MFVLHNILSTRSGPHYGGTESVDGIYMFPDETLLLCSSLSGGSAPSYPGVLAQKPDRHVLVSSDKLDDSLDGSFFVFFRVWRHDEDPYGVVTTGCNVPKVSIRAHLTSMETTRLLERRLQ